MLVSLKEVKHILKEARDKSFIREEEIRRETVCLTDKEYSELNAIEIAQKEEFLIVHRNERALGYQMVGKAINKCLEEIDKKFNLK